MTRNPDMPPRRTPVAAGGPPATAPPLLMRFDATSVPCCHRERMRRLSVRWIGPARPLSWTRAARPVLIKGTDTGEQPDGIPHTDSAGSFWRRVPAGRPMKKKIGPTPTNPTVSSGHRPKGQLHLRSRMSKNAPDGRFCEPPRLAPRRPHLIGLNR